MPEVCGGLLAVSIGMTLVPGIDTAMVLRSRRRAGLLTAARVRHRAFAHAAAVAVGLAALVAASATRIAGAASLIALGLATLWGRSAARRSRGSRQPATRSRSAC